MRQPVLADAEVMASGAAMPFPRRSRHDLVGIDNRRAGHLGPRLTTFPVQRLDSITEVNIRRAMHRTHPEAFVCANDRIAGQVMHSLIGLGYRLPQDVRILGIDDVEYASLLPVPLSTIRQPCREIGEAAVAAMLGRIARPDMLTRDISLECKLVVRQSCGAAEGTSRIDPMIAPRRN